MKTALACSSTRRRHTKGVCESTGHEFSSHIFAPLSIRAACKMESSYPPLLRRKPWSRNNTYSIQANAAQQEAGCARVSTS